MNTEFNHVLSDHQAAMLSMLEDLDAVCRAHGISYQLFSGTALGAVRHRGFIPWDDDLDVIMLRADYERFFAEAATDLNPEIYYVQKEFSAHWPMQFSKLRLNGTTCMEKFHPRDPEMHQGVCLDIFPCDNLSDRRCVRRLQFLASKVVIAKALDARGYATDSIVKKLFMRFCRLLPLNPFRRFAARRKEAESRMVHTFFGAGSKYEKCVFDRAWLTDSVLLPFESGFYPVSASYDELLTRLYGDYHAFPDIETRKVKQHAVILDLERPYTEHLDEQMSMIIDSYSRSIR